MIWYVCQGFNYLWLKVSSTKNKNRPIIYIHLNKHQYTIMRMQNTWEKAVPPWQCVYLRERGRQRHREKQQERSLINSLKELSSIVSNICSHQLVKVNKTSRLRPSRFRHCAVCRQHRWLHLYCLFGWSTIHEARKGIWRSGKWTGCRRDFWCNYRR